MTVHNKIRRQFNCPYEKEINSLVDDADSSFVAFVGAAAFFKRVEHPDVLGDDRGVYSYQRVPRAAFPPRQLGYPEASHGVADVVSQARVEGGLDEASLDVFTLL